MSTVEHSITRTSDNKFARCSCGWTTEPDVLDAETLAQKHLANPDGVCGRNIEITRTVATLQHPCFVCGTPIARVIYFKRNGKLSSLVICAPCAKDLAECLGFEVRTMSGDDL